MGWEESCKPKCEGGLGIRNVFEWNLASTFHQLWRIVCPGISSLWVNWFNLILLKNKGFWTAKLPYKSSWAVRKIFNCRRLASPFLKYHIGSNSSFLFWHDPWIDNKPLLLSCHRNVVINLESVNLDKISLYLHNGRWHFPATQHTDLLEIRDRVRDVLICNQDYVSWNGLSGNQVSLPSIWNSFRATVAVVTWSELVWNSFAIPKCSFILWLAIKNRLLTRDKLISYGMIIDPACLLCSGNVESVHHLFSDCPFFDLVRRGSPVNFSADWSLCQADNFFSPLILRNERLVGSLYLACAVYNTWKERNNRLHNPGPKWKQTMFIIASSRRMLKEKLFSCCKFQKWVRKYPRFIALLY